LTSQAQGQIALVLDDCDKGTSGGRAALRKKNEHFLDQPDTKKIEKSQKWPPQVLFCLGRLSPFVIACLRQTKVDEKNSEKPKIASSSFVLLRQAITVCHRLPSPNKS
jgi:hypothetical protein